MSRRRLSNDKEREDGIAAMILFILNTRIVYLINH
jgi:hypothetical protein